MQAETAACNLDPAVELLAQGILQVCLVLDRGGGVDVPVAQMSIPRKEQLRMVQVALHDRLDRLLSVSCSQKQLPDERLCEDLGRHRHVCDPGQVVVHRHVGIGATPEETLDDARKGQAGVDDSSRVRFHTALERGDDAEGQIRPTPQPAAERTFDGDQLDDLPPLVLVDTVRPRPLAEHDRGCCSVRHRHEANASKRVRRCQAKPNRDRHQRLAADGRRAGACADVLPNERPKGLHADAPSINRRFFSRLSRRHQCRPSP
ncbi:MAG: hypothetical protein WCP53_15850, partial [Verrucomicrobiota bacterium]